MSQHVCRGQRTILLLILFFHLVWDRILLVMLDAVYAGWPTREHSGILLSAPRFLPYGHLIREACSSSQLYLESGDLNLDPHACTASTFSTEPSPQPIFWTSDPPFSSSWVMGLEAWISRPDLCSGDKGTLGLHMLAGVLPTDLHSQLFFKKKCSLYLLV